MNINLSEGTKDTWLSLLFINQKCSAVKMTQQHTSSSNVRGNEN